MVGQCPLVGEAQALQLIKELEDKRVDELQRSNILMQRTLWAWDKDLTRSRHVEMFIEKGDRVQQLKALEAEDSPFCSLPASMKGSMAEDVVLNDKAGCTKYQKGVHIVTKYQKGVRLRISVVSRSWVVTSNQKLSMTQVLERVLSMDGQMVSCWTVMKSRLSRWRRSASFRRA